MVLAGPVTKLGDSLRNFSPASEGAIWHATSCANDWIWREALVKRPKGSGKSSLLDRSVHLAAGLRVSDTSSLCDRGLDRMAASTQFLGLATIGNTKRPLDDRHDDADVHSLHLWLASCGHSDCGGQLTPRIMAATLLRDNAIRFAVGLFTFTLLSSIGALARLETTVPPVVAFVAGLLGIWSLAAFLFLIDYAARLLTLRGKRTYEALAVRISSGARSISYRW
jgi:Predicted membrane protein (DUF2254)